MYLCVQVCMYACMYVCMYASMHVYELRYITHPPQTAFNLGIELFRRWHDGSAYIWLHIVSVSSVVSSLTDVLLGIDTTTMGCTGIAMVSAGFR